MLKKRKDLLETLEDRDGDNCHYCGINKGDFLTTWGEFYGLPYRGQRLEIEHKDAVVIEGKNIIKKRKDDTLDDCVLACSLCNMAKSNMFTYYEFPKIGKVIEEIWRDRKRLGLQIKQ